MMTDYKMVGNDFYDFRGQKVATLRGTDLYDAHGRKVSTIKDYEIYDDRYNRVASMRGDDVFDTHNTRVASLLDIKRMIDNPPTQPVMVAFWWFFIKDALKILRK
jgi:sporulation protein YlmC with PRC-barrel domain